MKGENYMDQIKIGKFIAKKRKEKGLTQSQLAEKLYVTDRAISKWENGKCIPDAANITHLCKLLNITINDLFSGEIVDMKENEKLLEKHLFEMIKAKEEKDKQLLQLEIVIGYISSLTFIVLTFIASYIEMPNYLRIILILFGLILLIFGGVNALKIEQLAGYYKCNNCNHKYVPTYNSVFLAMHIGRTRYMKCPKCNKRSWQKKVISK